MIIPFMQRPKPLTKVDITNRRYNEPGIAWLIANGFRIKHDNDRVWLVRNAPKSLLRILITVATVWLFILLALSLMVSY